MTATCSVVISRENYGQRVELSLGPEVRTASSLWSTSRCQVADGGRGAVSDSTTVKVESVEILIYELFRLYLVVGRWFLV